MVTPATDELKKRKRPPTFAHLPAPRAKKLKRVWVEKTKIKSKWKAMKRKEGWVSGPEDHRREEQEQDGGDEMLDDVADSADEHSDHLSDTQVDESQPEPEKPSLRELTREAYSRTSLHTFKADPLKRRRGARPTLPQAPRGRGGARGRGGDGGGRGRDVRGGQPNMKLRMGAMLERIKRDLT
ncbi:hypothetical protein BD410DRAFT_766317 [Rickenella mellea]|uniref:rRNA-processing protein FYV7 n=1 Tax=Rickenella mellea TaxID=50990 RepID=A0A4Y7QD78_9AGAM|nr:hypothetical protein BD410DRAFT_766317 [Rickenella mellea]